MRHNYKKSLKRTGAFFKKNGKSPIKKAYKNSMTSIKKHPYISSLGAITIGMGVVSSVVALYKWNHR